MSESDSTKVAWSDEMVYGGQFNGRRVRSRRKETDKIPGRAKKGQNEVSSAAPVGQRRKQTHRQIEADQTTNVSIAGSEQEAESARDLAR